jgi:hypothetical protein
MSNATLWFRKMGGAALLVMLLAMPQSAAASPICAAGDVTGDNSVNVLDIVTMVNGVLNPDAGIFDLSCSFLVGANGEKLAWAPDVNCDGGVNVLDIVTLVNRIMGNLPVSSIATDWDKDMYQADCDPCPGNEASPATEMMCTFPNGTGGCADAQLDVNPMDGQVDQCQEAESSDVVNMKIQPAAATGQGLVYSVKAAINWMGSGTAASENYTIDIKF